MGYELHGEKKCPIAVITISLFHILVEADVFRQLGNFSAHKIQYNANRKDIDNVQLRYRVTIEDLLYAAGIKK